VVLAMGCRERARGAIAIPGCRPAGVFTAGAAQRYVNMEGWLPGKRVVILGSGDIGLIMARRMTLEGAKVLACVEVMPYSGGLNRNIVQCLHDYHIPLYLSHTVTDIRGDKRVEQVVVSQVDAARTPIPGTEMVFDCDTLLLSVGLIPENELTRRAGIEMDPRTNGAVVYQDLQTSLPGVFACGNAAHVHDLVDFVSDESRRAGEAAARFVQFGEDGPGPRTDHGPELALSAGPGVSYTVPQRIRPAEVEKSCELFFRVNRVCAASRIVAAAGEETLAAFPRAHLAPGEMEHIALPRAVLDRAVALGGLTLSVEEVSP
jgi:pyruvate/2-oxoglutarate dehydrogenase complex dihydrolipoamide dehydrogenase (E3) component